MVGFKLSREEPNSLPNLGMDDCTGCTDMCGHVMRPGNASTEATLAICAFAERTHEQRGGAVRAATANGEAGGL